jgi:hypothetical protein
MLRLRGTHPEAGQTETLPGWLDWTGARFKPRPPYTLICSSPACAPTATGGSR